MAARLFTAVELAGSIDVKQQVVTAASRDYAKIGINRPHVDQSRRVRRTLPHPINIEL